jgi:precorrin-6Y C5,15-methyltransferase (decarboxylating)
VITVIGLDGSDLTPEKAARLASATLVVGATRHLSAVPLPPNAATAVLGNLEAALGEADAHLSAEERGERHVVVLASGDPGFFGIVRALRARGHRPEVLPGISSVALAFARAGLDWDDAVVVSAHGRPDGLRRAANVCRAHPKVAILTGPGAGPAEIARALAPTTPRSLIVCEDLGGQDERVSRPRMGEATTRRWRDPNVLIVLDPLAERRQAASGPRWIAGTRPGPGEWALPEEAFDHRDSMISKAEVRAFALAKLGPRVGDLVWDVGAGSGSVAIECARLGAAVFAVERDSAACDRIRRNVLAHGVKVALTCGQAPPALEPLPDPDAIFVGGGGLEVIEACAARGPRVLVAALASLERVTATLEILNHRGYHSEGVQLQSSRLAVLPDGTHRLAATNPVIVVWGTRPGGTP